MVALWLLLLLLSGVNAEDDASANSWWLWIIVLIVILGLGACGFLYLTGQEMLLQEAEEEKKLHDEENAMREKIKKVKEEKKTKRHRNRKSRKKRKYNRKRMPEELSEVSGSIVVRRPTHGYHSKAHRRDAYSEPHKRYRRRYSTDSEYDYPKRHRSEYREFDYQKRHPKRTHDRKHHSQGHPSSPMNYTYSPNYSYNFYVPPHQQHLGPGPAAFPVFHPEEEERQYDDKRGPSKSKRQQGHHIPPHQYPPHMPYYFPTGPMHFQPPHQRAGRHRYEPRDHDQYSIESSSQYSATQSLKDRNVKASVNKLVNIDEHQTIDHEDPKHRFEHGGDESTKTEEDSVQTSSREEEEEAPPKRYHRDMTSSTHFTDTSDMAEIVDISRSSNPSTFRHSYNFGSPELDETEEKQEENYDDYGGAKFEDDHRDDHDYQLKHRSSILNIHDELHKHHHKKRKDKVHDDLQQHHLKKRISILHDDLHAHHHRKRVESVHDDLHRHHQDKRVKRVHDDLARHHQEARTKAVHQELQKSIPESHFYENDQENSGSQVTPTRSASTAVSDYITDLREQYGYGVEADERIKEDLQENLNLPGPKLAELYMRIEDQQAGTPSVPPSDHQFSYTEGSAISVSDDLIDHYHLANGQLHSDLSETSGTYDANQWLTDKEGMAAKWRKGKDIECHNKTDDKWYPALIEDTFEHDGEQWLLVDMAVHSDEHVFKEVRRYGNKVRAIGLYEESHRSESSQSSEGDNRLLLHMHGLTPHDYDPVTEQSRHAGQHDRVILCHNSGHHDVNGKYVFVEEGKYMRRDPEFQNYELHHELDNDIWMFVNDETDHNYYWAQGEKNVHTPPKDGWEPLDGKAPPPTVDFYYTHEDATEDSEIYSDEFIEDEYIELTFKLSAKAGDFDNLGVDVTHTPNERHLILWDVPEGSWADRLGLRSQDIIHRINDDHIENSNVLLEALEAENFPCNITVLRTRNEMPKIIIEDCGIKELCGQYTVAGEHNDEFIFVKNDDINCRIYNGDHHNWIIGYFHSDEYDEAKVYNYYMVHSDEDTPPTKDWFVLEDGVEPCPKIRIEEEHIPHPTPPVITNVIPGDGCATVEFNFDANQLVPESAPHMRWWFQVQGKNCRQTGTTNSITVKGLSNGDEYEFCVKAVNQIISSYSKLSEPITPLRSPNPRWMAHENVYGVKGGDGECTIYFDDEDIMDDTVLASYFVGGVPNRGYIKLESSPHTIKNLENGLEYDLTLYATNEIETEGVTSRESLNITPLELPPMPEIGHIDQREDCLLIHYQCLGYQDRETDAYISCKTIPETDMVTPTKDRPLRLTNLTTGQPYTFQLVSLNTSGITEGRLYNREIVPKFEPTKPKVVSVVPKFQSVQVFFESHYEAVGDYEVEFIIETEPRTQEHVVPKGDRMVIIDGLTNGITYRLFVSVMNDTGYAKSELSEPFVPLDFPPTPTKFQVTKRRKFLKLHWDCEDIHHPEYDAEFLVWSVPSTGHVVHTDRFEHNFDRLQDGVEYKFYVKAINTVGSSEVAESESVMVHHKHLIVGCGHFGISEMQEYLDNTKVLCGLFMLELKDESRLMRLDFTGHQATDNVRNEAHDKYDRVTELFGYTDTELHHFDDKNSVQPREIIDLTKGLFSNHPQISKMHLTELVDLYYDGQTQKKMDARTSGKGDEAAHGDVGTMSEELQAQRVREIYELFHNPLGFVNWILFTVEYESDELNLLDSHAFGSGSVDEVCSFITTRSPKECIGVLQIEGETRLIHYVESEAQRSQPMSYKKLYSQLEPYDPPVIRVHGMQKVHTEEILGLLKVERDDYHHWLEKHLEVHPHDTQFLKTDQIAAAQSNQLENLISQVKDPNDDINWILIDPADC